MLGPRWRGAPEGGRFWLVSAAIAVILSGVEPAGAADADSVFNTTVARSTRSGVADLSRDAGHKDGPRDPGHGATVHRIALEGSAARTVLRVGLSHGVRAEVFTLADPYRVVIDLPAVSFQMPLGAGREGHGLITAYRYGLFSLNKGRIVLDASGPLRIENARIEGTKGQRKSTELVLDMVSVSAAEFGASAPRLAGNAPDKPPIYEDDTPKKSPHGRPVILIDPGHGGIDPGALGGSLMEKQVALAVADKIRRRLEATGKYEVHMTRSSDVFVSLEKRVKMSRQLGADLFISLHADAIASRTFAPVVRGATVYTLSEEASDEQARLMAEKENSADLLAGLDAGSEAEDDAVRGILIDLMKRETANFSADFSRMLVSNLKKSVSLSRDPRRSAAFRVLKQTHAPAVLVELGFVSNEADEKLMRQATWQGKVAQAIVTAVNAFFEKRVVHSP